MTTPGRAKVDVRQLLAERCLTLANVEDSRAVAPHVNSEFGGIVLSAAKPWSSVGELRRRHPELVLAVDTRADTRQVARPERPFALPDDDLLGEVTLERVLDDQINSGASFGVTPTFHIQAEDSDSLKAAVEDVNLLDRRDTLLLIPCDWRWLRPEPVRQLIAVLKRSRHPIALALADDADPLNNKDIPQGLRRTVDEVTSLVPWRTDLAGIDALARGALATAIGVRPGLRHAEKPGKNGTAINPKDRTPKVLVRSLLRYVRASLLQDWFASASPWTCPCSVCHNGAIDRFSGSRENNLSAHLHNVVCLTQLHQELIRNPRATRGSWWRERLREAEAQHETLSNEISMQVAMNPVLKTWLSAT